MVLAFLGEDTVFRKISPRRRRYILSIIDTVKVFRNEKSEIIRCRGLALEPVQLRRKYDSQISVRFPDVVIPLRPVMAFISCP